MFVPEHKHPLMSTRNRLHEFLVDDACAQKCSGMVGKNERLFGVWDCDILSLQYAVSVHITVHYLSRACI